MRFANFDDRKPFTAVFHHFAHAHQLYFYCLSEFCRHRHSERPRFHDKCMEIFCNLTTFRIILAIFYCAWAETAISQLAVTIMTSPLDSATPISRKRRKFRQLESVYDHFGPFFFAHVQNRHCLCFQSKICYHRRSQRHRLPIRGWKFLRFDNMWGNF